MALTSDQQKRCDEIVEQALALDASARDAFVAEACRNDEEIFREAAAVLTVDPRLTAIFQISPDSSLPPPQFGRYQTEAPIGKGGMSMVYRARDPVINRSVAVKVMARDADASPDDYRRFLSELHMLGSLHHPNIVQVFDAGDHEGSPFIVMEYLEGETLADAITHQNCGDFGRKLAIVRQLAAALQRVHAAAVCHRDVKPANVFLEPDGRVKLMDFGISARLDGPRLTQTGALIGTLPYLAPEQIRGERLGPSVDIYAFGVLLFELFTGSRPFSGSAAEILYKIVHEPLPTDALSKLPPRLIDLIRRSTAKEPSNRPRDVGEILQSLNQLPNENSGEAGWGNRWRIALGAAACVALVAGGFWIAAGGRSRPDTPLRAASSVPGRSIQPPAPALPGPEIQTPPKQEKVSEGFPSKPGNNQTVPATPKQNGPHPVAPAVNRALEVGGQFSPNTQDSSTPHVLPPEPVIPPVPKPQSSSTVAVRSPDLISPTPSDSKVADALPAEPKAPPSESAEDRHAADIRKIRDVLRRYGDANRAGNIAEIQTLRTLSTPQVNSLAQSFSRALPSKFNLEPQSDPEVFGDTATVTCLLTTQRNERGALQRQSDKPVVTPVTVHLARIAGVWKIQSME